MNGLGQTLLWDDVVSNKLTHFGGRILEEVQSVPEGEEE